MEKALARTTSTSIEDINTKPTSTELKEVFIGGLPASCTSQLLTAYFTQFGEIVSAEPQTWNKKSQKCRGFAIVTCADEGTFSRILNYNKHIVLGRIVECKRFFRNKEKLNSYYDKLKKRKLFVRGLSSKISTEDLESHFSRFGELEICYVVKHRKSGKSKGFGYICFKNEKNTHKVLQIGEFLINGKKVNCFSYNKQKNLQEYEQGRTNSVSKKSNEEKKIINEGLNNDILNKGENFYYEEPGDLRHPSFTTNDTILASNSKNEAFELRDQTKNPKHPKDIPIEKEENESNESKNLLKRSINKGRGKEYSLFGKFRSKNLHRKFNRRPNFGRL